MVPVKAWAGTSLLTKYESEEIILSYTPDVIYRYRPFSSQTLDLLCEDKQFFSNPLNFNDPFDSSPVIEVDSSASQLRKILKELVATRVRAETIAALKSAKLDETVAASHAEQIAQREAMEAVRYAAYHATNPEYDNRTSAEIGILRFDIERELRSRYGKGICCFSEEYNNPLLWSHYGDQHRGICIGYTLDRRPRPELKRVRYGGDRTITTRLLEQALVEKDADAIAQLDANVLLRKAPEWAYEKEWRLIGSTGLQESPLKLAEIIFGFRCSAAVQHTLMKALEGRADPIQFYEIVNKVGTYQLVRDDVDIEYTARLPHVAASALEIFGDPTPDKPK